MKYCNTCKATKSKSEFGNRKASIDGLSPKCKACQSAYDKARANNKNRVLARAAYAKTEAGIESAKKSKIKYASNNKEKIAGINMAYVAKNPKKRRAHKVIEKMVRTGVISISPCEECGSVTVHGHHDDYDKPSVVRWLCSKHHKQWHAKHGEGLNSK